MSSTKIAGETIHYEVLGRGRPLIFLHTWVGSWRYWLPIMQVISGEYKCYALDLWGFGDTAKKQRHYSLEEQVNLVEDFLREMSILRIAIVGHGLGALLAILLAHRAPEIISRVMTIGFPLKQGDINPRLETDSSDVLMDWLLSQSPDFSPVRSEVQKLDLKSIRTSYKESLDLDLASISHLEDTISHLMVCGQSDPLVMPFKEETTIRYPGTTQMMVFQQAGHYPMIDQKNQFNRLLIDFLALDPGVTPRVLQFKEEWIRRVR
ncbi:MAG: alpha/beta hydrolase [Anaerolineales bacterium]|nr:alpha/beta hydrolase [Anaerolineales bacterium]